MAKGPLSRAFYALHHRAIERPRDLRVIEGLARQVGRARSLLDVGVSHGRIAREVGARVGASRVEGVDVKLGEACAVPARLYDGERLPFEADEFEAAILSDMLHHAERPAALLREALRVARVLAIKDHVRFGPVSGAVLWGMGRRGQRRQRHRRARHVLLAARVGLARRGRGGQGDEARVAAARARPALSAAHARRAAARDARRARVSV
jgi:SAM-dependent methyltransferase